MPERSELREQIAETLWKTEREHVLRVFGAPGAPPKWEWEDDAGRKPFYAQADAALAVIAQDRAERLAQRMPEIEAATDDLVAAVLYDVAMGLTGSDDGSSGSADARARLLALIREVAG